MDIELTITDIAFGGKGIVKDEGFVIFVKDAVPGDQVLARITKKKQNYAEARVLQLLEPSGFRVPAPCEYADYCGGCAWQFLDYAKQLEYKRNHVEEALLHIGLLDEVRVLPTLPSDDIFHYRNKMEFSFSDLRWLMPSEMGAAEPLERDFALGLHIPGTFNKVLDVHKCWLMPEYGNDILNFVRDFARNSGLPVYGLKSHVGFWRFLMLRHSVAYDQWMVNIITGKEDPVLRQLADELTAKFSKVVSVVNNVTARRAGIAVGEYEVLLAGEPYLIDCIGDYKFKISANSFFQTNTKGAKKLYDTVKTYAALKGDEVLVDLYSGTGTIPIYLSGDCKQASGMEIVASAVADARENCALNDVSNCDFALGDIKDCLPGANVSPDVLIIDPPRVGMHQEVVADIMQCAPERIVYVSCNPATMARDIAMLKDGYHVVEVQPVDMFPHTFHIESVALLTRRVI